MKKEFEGFINFVREQGIVGLAIGFILGSGVSKVVTSLVNDIINPFVSLLLGAAGNLTEQFVTVGKSKVLWGNFLATTIDFVIIAAVVYYGVKLLGIEKKKEEKEKEKDKANDKKK